MEIRRDDDNELCGYVAEEADGWRALTVFGGELGSHRTMQEAARSVVADGLGSMASHWRLTGTDSAEEQLVCIQQVSPSEVTVALGYYSLPGVPTLTISRRDLESGRWRLRRSG